MVNDKIVQVLLLQNPFWTEKTFPSFHERSVYSRILNVRDERQIVSLCGLRRTGKTTLLMKLIQGLLEKNPADEILYFSFDDYDSNEMYPILDAFEAIHGKKPRFLFFDEVQKLPNWAEKVKILYDTGRYKMFVSGSESLFLKKGTRESLAGRIFEFEIKPLSFKEYLEFTGQRSWASKPMLYAKELSAAFEKYVQTSGFPELIDKPTSVSRDYLRSAVMDKIIYQDLPRLFPTENASKLSAILNIVNDAQGMLLELDSLSRELGIARQTLSKYIDYLEASHLVFRLYNYSRNARTSEKRLRKIYTPIATPLISPGTDNVGSGRILEALCARNTDARYFWRTPQKDEVDLIIQTEQGLLPVEIKRTDQPAPTHALEKFCKKYSCIRAVVVTKNTRKTEKKGTLQISHVPAWEFLLDPPQQKNSR